MSDEMGLLIIAATETIYVGGIIGLYIICVIRDKIVDMKEKRHGSLS